MKACHQQSIRLLRQEAKTLIIDNWTTSVMRDSTPVPPIESWTHKFRERVINARYRLRMKTDSWRTFSYLARSSCLFGTVPEFHRTIRLETISDHHCHSSLLCDFLAHNSSGFNLKAVAEEEKTAHGLTEVENHYAD